MMWIRCGLIASALLGTAATAGAAEFSAPTTVLIDNLVAFPQHVFFLYLTDDYLDTHRRWPQPARAAPTFRERWAAIEAGEPVPFPSASGVGRRPARPGRIITFPRTLETAMDRQARRGATVLAVPKELLEMAGGEPRPDWFAALTPGVMKVGEVETRYVRDDIGGQIARVLRYRVEDANQGMSLTLVQETDEYDLREFVLNFAYSYAPLTVVVVLALGIYVFIQLFRRRNSSGARTDAAP